MELLYFISLLTSFVLFIGLPLALVIGILWRIFKSLK